MEIRNPDLIPYKIALMVYALERDEAGQIIGERTSEPVMLYGIAQIRAWLDNFERSTSEP